MQTRSGSGTPRSFNAKSLEQDISGSADQPKFDFSAFEDVAAGGNPVEDPPEDFDIDSILQKLFAATSRAPGTFVNLEYDEISDIISHVSKIIMN